MAEAAKDKVEETPRPESASQRPPKPVVDEDSDPDFDDLDDVLDQFSANAPATNPPPTATSQLAPTVSSPGKPEPAAADTQTTSKEPPAVFSGDPPLPAGPKPDESEEQFIARLTQEMSTMLTSLSAQDIAPTSEQSPEDISQMGQQLEEFTRKMEAEGIQPEDLLRAILGQEEGSKMAEMAHEERDRRQSEPKSPSKAKSKPKSPDPTKPSASTNTNNPTSSTAATGSTSFEDTIRRTMSRLGESDTKATTAATQSTTKSEEDLLAEMLRALDSGDTSGLSESDDSSGLSKMFLNMMHQLTHKEMLYEPMKELDGQYPAWLDQNKPPKQTQEEYDRYTRQSVIVRDIVTKFEEPSFSDDDPKCREYVWEKMQLMQNEGAPPEELVKNPFPGTDFGGIPGLGGGAGSGGGGGMDGLEEGCPTQ